MNKNLITTLTIFGAVLILLAGITIIWFYFHNQTQECINNPFVYGAKRLTENYGHEFVGSGHFLFYGSPIYYFNSENITMEKIK